VPGYDYDENDSDVDVGQLSQKLHRKVQQVQKPVHQFKKLHNSSAPGARKQLSQKKIKEQARYVLYE
jgi:hypothetical protein